MEPIASNHIPAKTRPASRFSASILAPAMALIVLLSTLLSGCQQGSSDDGVDPGLVEIPIAYIKRPVPLNDRGREVQPDMRDPRLFSAGGDLFLRSSTGVEASEINLTERVTGGRGDIKGLNVSFDGMRLIFSLRLFDTDPADTIVPTWNIYEYNLETERLQRIIVNDLIAEQGDDLFPSYLPDGRIVFTSSRQKQSGENLINEGKTRFRALTEDLSSMATVLHVMNADGTDLRQISFNQSHDLYPQVLSNLQGGKIVFSRWEHALIDRGIHYYTVNPDGSELEVLYGVNSHDTGSNGAEIQFGSAREMENGDLMVITRPYSDTFGGGDIVIIDAERFADNRKPVWSMTGLKGRAQSSATINDVTNDGSVSIGGRYSSAYPLWDGSNRILVSKSSCQLRLNNRSRACIEPYLSDPNAEEAAPAYAIWLYDRDSDTEKPVVLAEDGIVITEALALEKRKSPPIIFDKGPGEIDSDQQAANVGVINIKSVYDMANGSFDGCFYGYCTTAPGINSVEDFANPDNATADQRQARFVRFYRPVGIPDPMDPTLTNPPRLRTTAYGPSNIIRVMREVVGYAAVEPDGSVKTRVPANLPLGLEILDGEGRRIGPTHSNWFQVQAGDTLTCNGCHIADSGGSMPEIHGRPDATAPSINSGLPASLQFINTLIPGTVTTPYWGDFGQTMAEVRFDRAGLSVPPGIETQLSMDLVYDDYWTDPGVRLPDVSYAYRYADLNPAMLSPANSFCSPWSFNCRSTINYPQHIHAIWQLDRGVDLVTMEAPANPPNNDPTNTPLVTTAVPNTVGDDTCIECHTTLDGTRVAYGQLDLTTDPMQNANQFFRSYRELMFTDVGETFDGLALVNFTRLVPDGMGGFIEQNDPAAVVSASVSPQGARASYFFEKMTGVELDSQRVISGSVDHTGMLTGAELKLIAEWLDLRGQNFNDPFDPDVPQF